MQGWVPQPVNYHTPPAAMILRQHAVLHPLLAPPIDRCDLLSADQHREVQVIAAGEAGHAAAPEFLPLSPPCRRL